MGGGLIQLVAYGAQDIYITGNPQITFFKAVYKRYTNFAIESFEQYPIGTTDWGNRLTFTIDRKGDLLGKSDLEFFLEFYRDPNSTITTTNSLPNSNANPTTLKANNTPNDQRMTIDEIRQELNKKIDVTTLAKTLGYSLIDYVEIEIGGCIMDHHSGHYMAIQAELCNHFNKCFENLILSGGFISAPHISPYAVQLTIPLKFWFNKEPGYFLPLVALQFHEVKINLKLNKLNKFLLNQDVSGNNTKVIDIKLIELNLNCDYVFLDTDERKRFAQKSHEYLIEQVQTLPIEYTDKDSNHVNIPLRLNHPVKELMWTFQRKEDMEKLGPLWSSESNRIKGATIQMNGLDRFPRRPGNYFQNTQKFVHHTGTNLHKMFSENYIMYNDMSIDISDPTLFTKFPVACLDPFIYSFSISPEKHQPTGTCNFSRIDNSILSIDINETDNVPAELGFIIKAYAINYNILRISSGMGGLAYSN